MERLFLHWLALLLPLCAALAPEPRRRAAEPAARPVAESDAESIEEWFVLELPAAELGQRRPGVEEVGLATLRRRSVEGVEQAEWDLRFFGDDTRVSHVERWVEGAPRLSWREWRPRSGRTLSAELGSTGLALVESGQRQTLRTNLATPEGLLLPIAALEQSRSGTLASGRLPWFDPLARRIETVSVSVAFARDAQPDSTGERVVERRVSLEREDGTLAAEWTFRGRELWGARWQSGGLLARRVAAADWDARVARCGRPADLGLSGR